MSSLQPRNPNGHYSTTSTPPEIKLGFDAQDASTKALAFVTAVEKSGWVQHEPDARDLDVDSNLPALRNPLIEWANAINPNRVRFDELDRMEHLWCYASDWRIINTPENTLIPAMTLIASFGWVARFWSANSLFETGDWNPVFPFSFLPFELVKTIWQAAKALQTGENLFGVEYPFRLQKERVSLPEARKHAVELVVCVNQMYQNLNGNTAVNVAADRELFEWWGKLKWRYSRFAGLDFETCRGDAIFEDGDTGGPSAHEAAVSFRLGSYAVATRSNDPESVRLDFPWMIPFWTPKARENAANLVPVLKQWKWNSQLEIESGKLKATETLTRQASQNKPHVNQVDVETSASGSLCPPATDLDYMSHIKSLCKSVNGYKDQIRCFAEQYQELGYLHDPIRLELAQNKLQSDLRGAVQELDLHTTTERWKHLAHSRPVIEVIQQYFPEPNRATRPPELNEIPHNNNNGNGVSVVADCQPPNTGTQPVETSLDSESVDHSELHVVSTDASNQESRSEPIAETITTVDSQSAKRALEINAIHDWSLKRERQLEESTRPIENLWKSLYELSVSLYDFSCWHEVLHSQLGCVPTDAEFADRFVTLAGQLRNTIGQHQYQDYFRMIAVSSGTDDTHQYGCQLLHTLLTASGHESRQAFVKFFGKKSPVGRYVFDRLIPMLYGTWLTDFSNIKRLPQTVTLNDLGFLGHMRPEGLSLLMRTRPEISEFRDQVHTLYPTLEFNSAAIQRVIETLCTDGDDVSQSVLSLNLNELGKLLANKHMNGYERSQVDGIQPSTIEEFASQISQGSMFGPVDIERAKSTPTDTQCQKLDKQLSHIYCDRPNGLDPALAEVFQTTMQSVKACTKLIASIPRLWNLPDEYFALAQEVNSTVAIARQAYFAVDIRLRRAAGSNDVLNALNDALTIQDNAPTALPPTKTLNAILTNLYTNRAKWFQRVDGRDVIDRMLNQLARVAPEGGSAVLVTSPLSTKADTVKKERIPKARAELLVHDWLMNNAKDHPESVTVAMISKATGVSTGQISKLASWKVFHEKRTQQKRSEPRTAQVSDHLLANIPEEVESDSGDELQELINQQKKDERRDNRMPRSPRS